MQHSGMNSRFSKIKSQFGNRRSSNQLSTGTPASSTTTVGGASSSLAPSSSHGSPLSQSNSSSTSIPMNGAAGQPPNSNNNNPDRPTSYTYSPRNQLGPAPTTARPASPLPPPVQPSGQVPPPLGTGYPPQAHNQMYGQPPPYPQGPPPPAPQQGGYGYSYNRGAELDGGGRNKAQLIVGIDFVRDIGLTPRALTR